MNIETRLKLEHLSETKELIREAIESKGQSVADSDTFRSYAEKVLAIETKTDPVLESLEVTENGTYTPSDGVDGFGNVVVNVPAPEVVLQDKTITENGTYTADSGFDGFGSVTVNVEGSGGSGGNPFVLIIGAQMTNKNSYNVSRDQTLDIPKNATILRAWANKAIAIDETQQYPRISSLKEVEVSSLTIDTTSNESYDIVTYKHLLSGSYSFSSMDTFEFRVLVLLDTLTVEYVGDGLYDATVHNSEYPMYIVGKDKSAYEGQYFKSLKFADGVTEVPAYVCSGQKYLDAVDLSNKLKIGNSAFSGCKSLKSISLNPNLTSLGQYAFNGCSSLSGELIIPDTITELGAGVFADCSSLSSVSLPSGLQSIDASVFNGCTSLSGELIIPDAITIISSYAFANTKFDKVVFPSGLTEFKSKAFGSCTHPTEFDFSACTKIPTLPYASDFLGVVGSGQVLKIPSALFDSWSTTVYWSDWASQMVAV